MIFSDRREAGRLLAVELQPYRMTEPVIFALPRGGVPVGFEVARALDAPLDVFVVRKLGAPGHGELAVGAVATGGITVVDRDMIALLGVSREYLAAVIARERAEVTRRAEQFGGGTVTSVAGRTVILVDDGIATGATAEAAVAAMRQQGAAQVIVAAPVAAPEAVQRLTAKADRIVCLETPSAFGAVGSWYRDFAQTSDAEVSALLHLAGRDHVPSGTP